MRKIYYINVDKKYIKENLKYFKNFNIEKNNKSLSVIDKLQYLYENGGLLISNNFLVVSDIEKFLDNEMFFTINTNNDISEDLLYVKEAKNEKIKQIIDLIKNEKLKLLEALCLIFNIKSKKNFGETLYVNDNCYIYPKEYFYPIIKCNDKYLLSENTVMINDFYIKKNYRLNVVRNYGNSTYKYLHTIFGVLKNNFAYKKYNILKKVRIHKEIRIANKKLKDSIKLFSDNYKEKEYIVIHHPNWLGVTNATKELFENLLPLQELYSNNYIKKLAKYIAKSNVKQVIFSAFADGWDILAKCIKKENPDIKIKCFWHGNNSQVIDKINWETNLMVIKLHKLGIIDVFATCKESLIEFYKNQGYKTVLIENTVKLSKEEFQKIKNNNIEKKVDQNNLKIGLYAAGMDWRKNMFNQIAAVSMLKNATIDSIPLNCEGQVFSIKNNLDIIGIDKSISRNEILHRMSKNDINLYVTFSECAPMVPLESMELGVMCITGDNHHYFKGTKLEEYLTVNREDDIILIRNKIMYAIQNKEEIFKLYNKWKEQHDITTRIKFKEFMDM